MITAEVQQVPPTPLPVDYDAEAAAQPIVPTRPTEEQPVYHGSDDTVPEVPRSRRAIFYTMFVLLALVVGGAAGAGVWYVMDSKTLISTPTPDPVPAQDPPAADAPPSPDAFPALMISETKPLLNCMGDCDDDSDCAPGLMCFQRNHNTEVPGCSGGLEDDSNTDYCIPIEQPSLVETNTFPLGVCEGDCDSNEDCQDGLVCYQRSEFEHVPGCSGGFEDGSRTDYCVPRSMVPQTYLMPPTKLVGNPDDNFGSSVSLSQSDPLLMAVGAVDRGSTGYVNIYQLADGGDWILVATIKGDEIGSDFGHSVSMSWDGKYVAVGMPRSTLTGAVQVFELSGISTDNTPLHYQQIGYDIRYNDWDYSGFGYSVSLSRDGRFLGVTQQASFRAYERTDSGDWVPRGSTLEIGSFGGGSVTLSGDGSRVAINNRAYNEPIDGYGRVYDFNGNDWVQVGQNLGDLAISDSIGLSNILQTSSSLSGDGTTVVMSCRTSGNSYVRVYQDMGDATWVPMGDPILSPVGEYAPASMVEISKDGEMVAIGDYDMGRVRLYEFEVKTGQWKLIDEVHADNEDDQFGVSLSLAGGRNEAYLAIGGPNKKHIAGNPGYTVTYKTAFGVRPDLIAAPTTAPTFGAGSDASLFSTVSSWYGEEDGLNVGNSVALSGDGTLVAYGVFSENSLSKVAIDGNQRSELSGSEIGDEFGYSIALSHDGQRMAVGIPNSRVGSVEGSGRVKVFKYDQTGASWTQMGSDLVGSGRFGHSVSVNRNGDIVAIGAPYSETGVSIFRIENNEWVKMGDDITVSVYLASYHGWSVKLSGDGLVVAIGGPTNEDNWDEAGACRVYEFVNNKWEQRGQAILGQQRHGLLGTSVSLSDDGNLVAIGAINYDLPEVYINEKEGVYHYGDKAGAVLVYKYSSETSSNGSWSLLGKTIFGDEAFDRFGTSVSLSKHENKLYLAAGAPEHGGGGHVRLFVFDAEHSYWDQIEEAQQYDPSYETGKNAGFGTTVALASGSDGLRMAIGAPRARSGWGERLGLLPKYDGEVTLWQP
jgi:hypothetical protein